MNYKMMGHFVAQILTIGAVFMLPALCISLYYREDRAVYGFLLTLGIFAVVIGLLQLTCRSAPSAFYAREGLVCVGVSWIVLSLLSYLPFYFSGEIISGEPDGPVRWQAAARRSYFFAKWKVSSSVQYLSISTRINPSA